MADGIDIVQYDPAWVDDYCQERDRLMALPRSPFENMEHIGSTSVPGLPSKPIVDILASVQILEAVAEFIAPLEGLGYRQRDVGFEYRKFLQRTSAGRRVQFNLHIVTTEAWPDKSERLFRDWLCAHPDVAEAYAELKVMLAGRHADDMQGYTDAKDEFIRTVVNNARVTMGLAIRTDWRE